MLKIYSIVILSVIGFGVAFCIWKAKQRPEPVRCIIGNKQCDTVVRSSYSKFLGLNNEVWGMAYYVLAAVSVFYSTQFLMFPALLAVIYSSYLLVVQIRLKEWCDWCVASTMITFAIFLLLII